MRGVDPGVDDADQHVGASPLGGEGAPLGGVDHRHVPLPGGQRLGGRRVRGVEDRAGGGRPEVGARRRPHPAERRRAPCPRPGRGRSGGCGPRRPAPAGRRPAPRKSGAAEPDQRQPDRGVLARAARPRPLTSAARAVPARRPLLVEHHVLGAVPSPATGRRPAGSRRSQGQGCADQRADERRAPRPTARPRRPGCGVTGPARPARTGPLAPRRPVLGLRRQLQPALLGPLQLVGDPGQLRAEPRQLLVVGRTAAGAGQGLVELVAAALEPDQVALGLAQQVPQRRGRSAGRRAVGVASRGPVAAAAGSGCRPAATAPPTAVWRWVARNCSSHAAWPPGQRPAKPRPSSTTTSATVRSRKARSWLTTTSAPGQSSRKSSSARSVSRSRSLVGSSSSSTLGWRASVATSCSRRRSPPDSESTGAHMASASNQKRRQSASSVQSGRRDGPATTSMAREPAVERRDRAGRSSRRRRSEPVTTAPAVGVSRPARISSSVDLPAPFGAEDAEALPGVEGQVEAVEEQRPVAPAVADPGQLDHRVAQSGGAGEQQVELARPGRRRRPALDGGGRRRQAGLGLGGAGRRAPPQPLELAAGEVAALVLGVGAAGLPLGPTVQVALVAPGVQVGAAPVELQHPPA